MHDKSPYSAPFEVSDETTISDICLLRERVWRDTGCLIPNAFGPSGWRDPIDMHCRHWIILDRHDTIVAAGRLSVHDQITDVHESEQYLKYGISFPGTFANPDRVVVDQAIAGHGLGRKILDAQDGAIASENIVYSVRQASPRMVRLLLNRGWHVAGSASSDRRFPGMDFSVVIRASPDTNGKVPDEYRIWRQRRKVA